MAQYGTMKTWKTYQATAKAENPRFHFARIGDAEGLRSLPMSTADVDEVDARGYSALMLAAYHGHEEAVGYLLLRGANANGRDPAGNTVLMGAAFKGHLPVVRILVGAGADPRLRNPKGQTALDFANLFGRAEVSVFLKTKQYKPGTFGLRDILSGWSSFFTPRSHA